MEGFTVIGQEDFSAGAFPLQERMPRNAAQDIINGLVDDDGSVYARGGGSYLTSGNLGANLGRVWAGRLSAGPRVLFADILSFYAVAADGHTPVGLNPTVIPASHITAGTVGVGRAAVGRGILFLPSDPILGGPSNQVLMWAGALAANNTTGGTIDITAGSTTVVGHSTTWGTAGVPDAGSLLIVGDVFIGVVKSITNSTHLELVEASAVTASGSAYSLQAMFAIQPVPLDPGVQAQVCVGFAGGKLLVGYGNRVWMTDPTTTAITIPADNFHELPAGAVVTGIADLDGRVYVFTTGGVWAVTNIAYDLTDDFGNVQQELVEVARDLRLWGSAAIVSDGGTLIVPATDDVYTVSRDGVRRFAAGVGVRKLLQSHVAAGYQPGGACVYRGHYVLPVRGGVAAGEFQTWKDTLVCKLSTGAWSRMADDDAECLAFAERVGDAAREPVLLGVSASRVLDLSGWFAPAEANILEANDTQRAFKLVPRPFSRSSASRDAYAYVRVRYELAGTDAPVVDGEVSVGGNAAWTALSGSLTVDDGQHARRLKVGKKAQLLRVRLTGSGLVSTLVVRSVEALLRPSGRQ